MKNQLQKDKRKRNLHLDLENKRIILKNISNNTNVTKPIRWNSELELTNSSFNSSKKNQIVNRCILTGRKSKVAPKFRVSRLSFLKLARNGFISGLKKSMR